MEGVPGDEEISLLDHITEFRSRLIIVLLALCTTAAIAYPFSGMLIRMIWSDLLPEGTQMTVYAPLELIITKMTISFIIAFAIGIPLLMYELLAFVGKGLYPSEKRFFIKIVPLSLILFLSGGTIAYLIIVPIVFNYTVLHSADLAVAGLSLRKTFSVVTTLVLGFGVMFQFPMLMIAAIKMGLLKQKQLEDGRLIVYGGLIAFAMFATPDATGVSQLIVAVMLVILFEFSLVAARFL
jgi:sec-independent protein translocase protein TatC